MATDATSLDGPDADNMFGAIQAFPDHFRDGWIRAADIQPPHRPSDFDGIVIVGMGGSAIGGDLLRAFAEPTSPLPIFVRRDYDLPRWVGERTLVIASSYSGNTEETLSSLAEAFERKATVYAVTSGGELLEEAQVRGIPHVLLPGGMQPRAALGYSFAALLRIAEKLGLVDVTEDQLNETTDLLGKGASVFTSSNSIAGQIAEQLHGRMAIIHTGPGLLQPVGLRWQTQIHENSKQLAFGREYPELNHNEIVGWEQAPSALRKQLAIVALRDSGDHPQVHRRMDITKELLEQRAGIWVDYESNHTNRLARMLTSVQLGDWVSFHLAMRAGVDPTPVDTIEQLKSALADTK